MKAYECILSEHEKIDAGTVFIDEIGNERTADFMTYNDLGIPLLITREKNFFGTPYIYNLRYCKLQTQHP